jgi:hypothetical protein
VTMVKFSREHHSGSDLRRATPGNAPTTTSPGFNALLAPPSQTAREMRA